MPNNLKRHFTAAIVTFAFLIIAVGCSTEHPFSPVSSESSDVDQRFDSPQTDVEISSRVATSDPVTRSLTFTDSPETAIAAADAEIVRKIDGIEEPITFEEIMVGDSVEVRGVVQGDGTLLADRIRVRGDDDNGAEIELYGTVNTIDPDARTITLVDNATLINVRLDAEIVNWDTQIPIALLHILPGDSLEIRGYLQQDGSLEANRVRLRTGEDDDDNYDVEFEGPIVSIDYAAGSFMVEGRPETILVDSLTPIYTDPEDLPDFSPSSDDTDSRRGNLSFEHLVVGDYVEVKANIIDPSTLMAVRVELEDGQNELEFSAVLASVDAGSSTVTFEGRTETGVVLDDAELQGLNNEPLTLADFSAGEIVEVKGFVASDGQFLIFRMHKDNNL